MLYLGSEEHRFGTVFSLVFSGGKKALSVFQLRFSLHGHFSSPEGTYVGLLVVVGVRG